MNSWTSFGRATCSWTQMTLASPRSARSWSTPAEVSSPISGVSGDDAHSTSWTSSSNSRAALIRWTMPFCRVMRPTNST